MHALALYLLLCSRNTNDGENGRGTDQHTKSCFFILAVLFIRTRGPEKQGTYVCVLSFLLFVSLLLSFLFGMSLRAKDGRGQILFMHTPRTNGRFSLLS